jgi:hypothetical protein
MADFEIQQEGMPQRGRLRVRPPPDFARRSVKLRIFGLLAGLFLVMGLVERAADPRTWQWLTATGKQLEPLPEVQSRLLRPTMRTERDPAGTFVAADKTAATSDQPLNLATAEASGTVVQTGPAERAWNQGWRDILRTLRPPQRELLFRWLLVGQRATTTPDEIRASSEELLTALDKFWSDYQATAHQSVQKLSADEQKLWSDVLRQVDERWANEVRPAIEVVVGGDKPSAEQVAAIGGLEQTLRPLALNLVQDDTTLFRSAEREIWLHLLAQLQALPAQQSARTAADASYLQLFKQSDDYRGRLVRIRGIAKLGYQIEAPDNYLGVERYEVLVIQPQGGPDSPIMVVSLGLPAGFPKLKHRDKNGEATKLHEDVVVTGYSFKRLAYQATDGMYAAPLIVARTADWNPRTSLADARKPRSLRELATMVGLAALGATVTALIIAWRTQRVRRESRSQRFNFPDEQPNFSGIDIPPSPRDALAELSRKAYLDTSDRTARQQNSDS